MTAATFHIGHHTYAVAPLGALLMNDIVRKLSMPLARLATLRKAAAEALAPSPSIEQQARAFCALCADVADDDMASCMGALLGAVSREMAAGKGFAPVRANGQLMFQDITFGEINEMAVHVLDLHRAVDFFSDLPSGSPAPKGQPA